MDEALDAEIQRVRGNLYVFREHAQKNEVRLRHLLEEKERRLADAVAAAVADEREACAKLFDDRSAFNPDDFENGKGCGFAEAAEIIRARGASQS